MHTNVLKILLVLLMAIAWSSNAIASKRKHRVVEGHVLIEGDIAVGTTDELTKEAQRRQLQERGGIAGALDNLFGSLADGIIDIANNVVKTFVKPVAHWPNGKIPYTYDSQVENNTQLKADIESAMRAWQSAVPDLHFVPRHGERNYIQFAITHDDRLCGYSRIGMEGGLQLVLLQEQSCGVGTALHELGHALGLQHEQTRPDRDRFIKVHFEHIDPDEAYNFDKHPDFSDYGPYDYMSIMHYSAHEMSKDGEITLEPTPCIGNKSEARCKKIVDNMGHRNGLSPKDILAITCAYTHAIGTMPGCLSPH